MDDVYFIERDSDHWHAMWKWLGEHPWNEGLPDPISADCEHECWQYMGTEPGDAPAEWFDCFRHRYHPRLQRRVYLRRLSVPPTQPQPQE